MPDSTQAIQRKSLLTLVKKRLINFISRFSWSIAPEYTIKAVHKLFFTPRAVDLAKENEELIKRATRLSIPTLGKTVRGWKWGEGPVILLAHGWGSTGLIFAPLIARLVEAGAQVVAYDSLANGESDGETTNFFEFIESINSVAQYCGPVEGVVAHSMGAAAAMNLARGRADNLKMVFIAAPFYLHEIIYGFGDEIGLYMPLYDNIIKNLEEKFGKTLHDICPPAVAPGVASPVLIVHDKDDKQVPIAQAELLAKNLPNARLIKTSGLGHSRILKSREMIDETILFLGRRK